MTLVRVGVRGKVRVRVGVRVRVRIWVRVGVKVLRFRPVLLHVAVSMVIPIRFTIA